MSFGLQFVCFLAALAVFFVAASIEASGFATPRDQSGRAPRAFGLILLGFAATTGGAVLLVLAVLKQPGVMSFVWLLLAMLVGIGFYATAGATKTGRHAPWTREWATGSLLTLRFANNLCAAAVYLSVLLAWSWSHLALPRPALWILGLVLLVATLFTGVLRMDMRRGLKRIGAFLRTGEQPPRLYLLNEDRLAKALSEVVSTGDDAKLAELLKAGAPQTVPGMFGQNALMVAAAKGHSRCVSLLVGAEDGREAAQAQDSGRDTALIKAAVASHLECVQILLPFSDAHASNNFDRTALMWTATQNVECLKAILANDPSTALDVNAEGETALMMAARMGDEGLVAVQALLPHCNPRAQDKHGRTALAHAASAGCSPAIVAHLAAAGGAELRDRIGFTPLIAAVADRLLLLTLAMEHTPAEERDATLLAADRVRAQIVEALLPVCELDAADHNGATALDWAEEMGFDLCAEKLRAAGAQSKQPVPSDEGRIARRRH